MRLMPERIEIENFKKISKGMKSVRIPHTLHTLPNFHFFQFLKSILNVIWIEYWLNKLI